MADSSHHSRSNVTTVLQAACCLISADGRVSSSELVRVSQALAKLGFHRTPDELKASVVAACKEIVKVGLATSVAKVSQNLHALKGTPAAAVAHELCLQFASADGGSRSDVQRIANTFCAALSATKVQSQHPPKQYSEDSGHRKEAGECEDDCGDEDDQAGIDLVSIGRKVGIVVAVVALLGGRFFLASKKPVPHRPQAQVAGSADVVNDARGQNGGVSKVSAGRQNDLEVTAQGVRLKGSLLSTPFPLKAVTAVLGNPSRTAKLQANIIHTWDSVGVIAYQPYDSEYVSSLGVFFDSFSLAFAPRQHFEGVILLNGRRLRSDSRIEDIRAAGLVPQEAELGRYRTEVGTFAVNIQTRNIDAVSRGEREGLVDRVREFQVSCEVPATEHREATPSTTVAGSGDPVEQFKGLLVLIQEQVASPREYLKCSKGTYNQKPNFAGAPEDAGKPYEHWERIRKEMEIVSYDIRKTSSLVSPLQAILVIRSREQTARPQIGIRLQTEAMAFEVPYSPATKWFTEECLYNYTDGKWVVMGAKDKWPFNPTRVPREERNGGIDDRGGTVWTYKRLK